MISQPTVLALNNAFSDVPLPSSISYLWNGGSLLAACLAIQVLTGVFLSFHYSSSIEEAFSSVCLLEEVSGGRVLRSLHANGASFFFTFIYLHVSRGIYFGSFRFWNVWISGVVLLSLLMASAFLGYVLPWGQMSFWGATVITNLLSAFPGGENVVEWVWGGFSVSGPTLSRFFSLHFILPLFMVAVTAGHILLLHENGSSNPLGLPLHSENTNFHPLFTQNDISGLVIVVMVLGFIVLLVPDMWMDPDNFSPANPLSTPQHIQPEWYFLFAYAILRSVPNNLGGVIALVVSVFVLFLFPWKLNNSSCRFHVWNKSLFWSYVSSFTALTILGAFPAEGSLVTAGVFFSTLYFLSVGGLLVL